MISHSIRWNLQLWLAFLLGVLLTGFCVSMYQLERRDRFHRIDEDMEGHLSALKNVLTRFPSDFDKRGPGPFGDRNPDDQSRERIPGGPKDREFIESPDDVDGFSYLSRPVGLRLDAKIPPDVSSLFDAAKPDGFYYAVWLPGRTLLLNSSNCPPESKVPDREQNGLTHLRNVGDCREAYFFTAMGDCLLVGRNISGDLRALEFLAWGLLGAGGLFLILGLGVGWWLTTRALRPVEEISASAQRISGGNLSERIMTADPGNEIGRLAVVLNSMFGRLEAAFTRQRQFTADASHELRTPLAVIISEAQTTLARERSAGEYRETIEVCLESAQQMRRLADSLLELARFDAGQQEMAMECFELDHVVRERIDAVRSLPQAEGIEFHETLEPVNALGDADRIGQVVMNLLINAIQYGGNPGVIEIVTRSEGDRAVLVITDHGPGIGQEDLPHIFERFYRADKARARVKGNHGVGLAICKTIIDAHQGSIEAASRDGQGASLIVKLPMGQEGGKDGTPMEIKGN
jgi:signal transduction histidine kinase